MLSTGDEEGPPWSHSIAFNALLRHPDPRPAKSFTTGILICGGRITTMSELAIDDHAMGATTVGAVAVEAAGFADNGKQLSYSISGLRAKSRVKISVCSCHRCPTGHMADYMTQCARLRQPRQPLPPAPCNVPSHLMRDMTVPKTTERGMQISQEGNDRMTIKPHAPADRSVTQDCGC